MSSKNMYSEHGLDALMRPPSGHVCHSLTVVSNCTPGSAEDQDDSLTFSHKSRACTVFTALPLVREVRFHSLSFSTALRKSLVRRTELFEFWPDTVW